MADLNVEHGGPTDRVSTRGEDRGQILLIAAFTLAVTFVALALVVNSAIFTENLASRGEVAGSSEALTYQHQVEDSVADAMAYANRYDESSLGASVDAIGGQSSSQQARGGQVVNVSLVDKTDGTRIADNASGGSSFLNESAPSSSTNWRLASTVEGTRNVRINITDTGPLATTDTNAFTLEANQSKSTIWEMRVEENGSNVDIDVETAGDTNATCSVPNTTPIEIDVTRGQVNGEPCHALSWTGPDGEQMWWGTGITAADYDIWIKNGDRIRGNYSMIVDGSPDTQNLSPSDFASGDDPYETTAIYSARIDYVYMTSQVNYNTTIEVAPGEAP